MPILLGPLSLRRRMFRQLLFCDGKLKEELFSGLPAAEDPPGEGPLFAGGFVAIRYEWDEQNEKWFGWYVIDLHYAIWYNMHES